MKCTTTNTVPNFGFQVGYRVESSWGGSPDSWNRLRPSCFHERQYVTDVARTCRFMPMDSRTCGRNTSFLGTRRSHVVSLCLHPNNIKQCDIVYLVHKPTKRCIESYACCVAVKSMITCFQRVYCVLSGIAVSICSADSYGGEPNEPIKSSGLSRFLLVWICHSNRRIEPFATGTIRSSLFRNRTI